MPSSTVIAPGMRVTCRDAEWLVTKVVQADQQHKHLAVHCVGADDLVRGQERIFLQQLDDLEPVDPRQTELVPDTSSNYRLARLFLEAQLRQTPMTSTDPNLAGMGVFQEMDYQRDAVHRALLQLRPRLLLADAVGLGKTIEVGMILAELMRRGRADRILVLARKSMLTQFQSELWNRFTIPLVRLDSAGIANLRLRIPASKNPFEIYHRIIISIDTLKDVGRYRHFLESTRWDVVIIDEAHNVAGASVPERHLAYRLARLLSRRTDSLLLTTATPHNGKRETFGRLISLLDPSAIPDPRLREYDAQDISQFFIMRFKEDIREEAGDNFRERQVVPLAQTSVDAHSGESAVFSLLGRLRQLAADQRQLGGQADTLFLYGLYKLFLSSPEACRSTLEKRLKKIDDTDTDTDVLVQLQAKLAPLALRDSSRFQLLKRQLHDLGWDGSPGSPRLLIFTEYRHTQDALVDAISRDYHVPYNPAFEQQAEQTIAKIHGSVPDTWLMKTVESFGTGKSPMRLLVATDVASEGINLHHQCHDIIHYDLPWSIITLIQRNGRIDRFGQKQTPCLRYLIVNANQPLFAGDSHIFANLVAKVEEINRSTRTGESVLKLYDPDAEERYIAEHGVLAGDTAVLDKADSTDNEPEAAGLEAMLRLASEDGFDDYAKFLTGEQDEDPAAKPDPDTLPAERVRLFSDRDFLLEGYRFLARQSDYPDLTVDDHLITLTAPPDLKRRLGSPDQRRDDVIFGATAIPSEAWPQHHQFQLTSRVDYAALAIQAAQNTAGHWSRVQLICEQHPILQWIGERLLMLMQRREAPYIQSPHLAQGELCFCFIGQVSSRAGAPLAVDAHAISYLPGGASRHRSLQEALHEARFQQLISKGGETPSPAAEALIASAVDASLAHLDRVKYRRDRSMAPILRKELRRLRDWSSKRRDLLKDLIADLSPRHPKAHQYSRELEEIDHYLQDREANWQHTWFDDKAKPSTRLVLVIEGIKA